MITSVMDPMRVVSDSHTNSGVNEGAHSAVSWAAVAAGAFVAAALGLILLALGAGAGLSALSPWATSGLTSSAVGKGALLWVAGIEVVASGVGGYMAGRLRTKWVNVHSDEVYFRDTAHGFLSWAVALVFTAGFLTSAASIMVGGAAGGAAAARSDQASEGADRYFVDQLYRVDKSRTNLIPADAAMRAEAGTILNHSLRQREMAAVDKSYLTANVVARAGLNSVDADARVTDVFARAQEALDAARKATSHALYWLFVALLLGAFSASAAATIGGRQRDHLHAL